MDVFIINTVNILRSLMFESNGNLSLNLNVFKNPLMCCDNLKKWFGLSTKLLKTESINLTHSIIHLNLCDSNKYAPPPTKVKHNSKQCGQMWF
jgi:hypothetical protein